MDHIIELGGNSTDEQGFRGADYIGTGRGRVKHEKRKAIRRAEHVEEHRLTLGGSDADIRRRLGS